MSLTPRHPARGRLRALGRTPPTARGGAANPEQLEGAALDALPCETDARPAVERLLDAALVGGSVKVLMGDTVHDCGDAPVGSYVGTTPADDETVGSYARARRSEREAMGSFAGDVDAQRRGGFSDVDRETVTTYADEVTRLRIASHHNLRKMLLNEASAKVDVEALREGRILVLVRSRMGLDAVAAVIDG